MAKRRYAQWPLRAWRKHRKLSQEALADRVGTSRSRIAELELGCERYNQDILEALAAALSLPGDPVTPADLLSRRPGEPQNPFDLWDRIPAADRGRAGRIIGRVMEDFVADFEALPAPPAIKPARKKKTT